MEKKLAREFTDKNKSQTFYFINLFGKWRK